MKVLITGAAGYIGNKLAHCLANRGVLVHALVRSDEQRASLQHPNIVIFKGDVCDMETLKPAIENCRQVYHTAAKVGAWLKDPSLFYTVNVGGTNNVFLAAVKAGVEKVVFTSTSGVLGPTSGAPLQEDAKRRINFKIDYDISKKEAECVVMDHIKNGVNAVIVSPSKIFGPGVTSHSMTANAIIRSFLTKKITFIPSPGTYQVCFAFVDDVVNGHFLAMEKGTAGEKYILGGANITYYDFFNRIRILAGYRARIISMPKKAVKLWAYLQQANHYIFSAPVHFPAKTVDHAFTNYTFSSQKAISQLGYAITPLDNALLKTIQFLKPDGC
jgi:nucleoside-diphosphate-sugar epimerase